MKKFSLQILIFLLCIQFLQIANFSSLRRKKQPKSLKKCQIQVPNAKVQRLRPRILLVKCHQGHSTSTGQDQILIKCKKNFRSKVDLCLKKVKKVKNYRPYPLFQSDDPNVDENIILLDNDDKNAKETGVYTLEDYDDYAEYDYKVIKKHIQITYYYMQFTTSFAIQALNL